MENMHIEVHTSSNKDALQSSRKKMRITEALIEKSRVAAASILEEADELSSRRALSAEDLVLANLETINILRDRGFSVSRIHSMFVKKIRLGISPESFARYVRKANGKIPASLPAISAPTDVQAEEQGAASESGPVADWGCSECQTKATPEKYKDSTIWLCPACGTGYASGEDGKISATRFSG